MSAEPEIDDFQKLVREVMDENHCWWGSDKLAIWGGMCAEADLHTFLKAWDLPDEGMSYVIWEYVDDIIFSSKDEEAQMKLNRASDLERGRIFGQRGDLSLRRDGQIFRWHFIGDASLKPPAGYDAEEGNFFRGVEAGARFLCREEHALLWGERKGEPQRWFEDRVARAILKYPTEGKGRVKICYRTFSRAGNVEFVWFIQLEAVSVKEKESG